MPTNADMSVITLRHKGGRTATVHIASAIMDIMPESWMTVYEALAVRMNGVRVNQRLVVHEAEHFGQIDATLIHGSAIDTPPIRTCTYTARETLQMLADELTKEDLIGLENTLLWGLHKTLPVHAFTIARDLNVEWPLIAEELFHAIVKFCRPREIVLPNDAFA